MSTSSFAVLVQAPTSDLATTGTHLDWIVGTFMSDPGLAASIPHAQLVAGAEAANGLDTLLAEGGATLHLADDGQITADDVLALNAWVRADAGRLALFTALHGNDDNGAETGYHLIKGDGAAALLFHQSMSDTVIDGLFHFGFPVVDGRFLNEDGNPNATVQQVADYLDYYLTDLSTTGTGLDFIVDAIKSDTGLSRLTLAPNLRAGAIAADQLDHMLVDGIDALHLADDGIFTASDMLALNGWVRADAGRLALFTALHGTDAGGTETGFHLVRGDGGVSTYLGANLIDTIADGIYHFGFAVVNNHFLNENGNRNASIGDVASWLNHIYFGLADFEGTDGADKITGTDAAETFHSGDGNDTLVGQGADLWGEAGNDLLIARSFGGSGGMLTGGAGADTFRAELVLDADASLIAAHLQANGMVDWAGVAADPAAASGAWLVGLGRVTVTDFSHADGDHIELSGAGVCVMGLSAWTMSDGRSNTTIAIGTTLGGAAPHAVGEMDVLGDAVTRADILVDGGIHAAHVGATAVAGFNAYGALWSGAAAGWAYA